MDEPITETLSEEVEAPVPFPYEDDNLEDRSFAFVADEDGMRLDIFLRERLTMLSRSHLQRLIRESAALVNGASAKPSRSVHCGDKITLELPPLIPTDIKPEDIPLDIIYEDADFLIVNKPKGLTVHPTPNQSVGTLVNALLFHCGASLSGINGTVRPGIVHRIDKNTSGLLAVAKNDLAHLSLAEQIRTRTITKLYTAVVHGKFAKQNGKVETMIGRSPRNRKKMAVVREKGRNATTVYRVVQTFNYFSEIDVDLRTGRTHQIRVHMSHTGHPVAGDVLYGGAKLPQGLSRGETRVRIQDALDNLIGQALHARELFLSHPRTGKQLHFEAPFPPDTEKFLDFLKNGDES
jgi:23S rRNA pseudouridine1911/1915/1917 synthase